MSLAITSPQQARETIHHKRQHVTPSNQQRQQGRQLLPHFLRKCQTISSDFNSMSMIWEILHTSAPVFYVSTSAVFDLVFWALVPRTASATRIENQPAGINMATTIVLVNKEMATPICSKMSNDWEVICSACLQVGVGRESYTLFAKPVILTAQVTVKD